VENLEERFYFGLLRVGSNNKGKERKAILLKSFLLLIVIPNIYERGLHGEKRVAMVPSQELLSL
jgi:hypothetical protein